MEDEQCKRKMTILQEQGLPCFYCGRLCRSAIGVLKMPSFRDKESPAQLSKDFGRLFKYGLSEYDPRHEKVDEMYTLKWNCFDHSDVQKGIDNVLGPLSLFAPSTNEDAVEQVEPERSTTPIDDEIKTQPQTFDKIANYVRRRITAKPNVPFLSAEDQKNLAAIIMGEVNGIWPDIRRQIDDPFLTVQENKELNRRIAVHIVTVCEKLFHHYLRKAQVLNNRGVFSGPANMSRLKVQLALEASEMLNILKIRRYIVNDIRMSAAGQSSVVKSSPRSTQSAVSRNSLAMFSDRCTSAKYQKIRTTTVKHELYEILNSMPVLDTSHLMELVADLPQRELHLTSEEALHARSSHISGGVSLKSHVITENSSKLKTTFKRCNSQPLFDDGGNFLEELDIDCRVKSDKLIELELDLLKRERHQLLKTDKETEIHFGSRDFIENDLKQLTECKKDEILDGNSEDDLPPLVQAITRHARHDDLKQRMEKQLMELEDRQKLREEEECIEVRDAAHPQPDTVIAKLGNNGVVQTSDIRVSERVCMSSMTLKRLATVYNDLLEEISQDTVKNLDKNLFLSDEIHEVYNEIMKTVPSTHMELDDLSEKDPLVLNAPDSLDLSNTMASSTLSCKVLDRIINPAFRQDREPPWVDGDRTEWEKTPVNPPKNAKGEDLFAAMAPTMSKIHGTINNIGQIMKTGKPTITEEKIFRTYTSWLQWWKSTVTSDDYMKYLSVQETDFLGALFHLYDSEEDDESENDESTNKLLYSSRKTHSSTRGKVSTEERERMRKLKDLQNLKSVYKKGFWNANAVLMGGLGKDPELAEEKPKESRTSRSAEQSNKKRASQMKMTQEKRDRNQGGSKTTTKVSEHTFEDLQGKLESVWQQLQVPDSQRLDMAIKYSCDGYFHQLTEAIERWEFVSQLILQRETLLVNLESFERQASDPNRFFAKDSKNSIYRLEESRQRACLYKKIDSLDADIKEEVEYIQGHFHDVITYKGRPYINKMKWDRTEMLYWLSEERKENGLMYEAVIQGLSLPLRPAQLQPISPSKPFPK